MGTVLGIQGYGTSLLLILLVVVLAVYGHMIFEFLFEDEEAKPPHSSPDALWGRPNDMRWNSTCAKAGEFSDRYNRTSFQRRPEDTFGSENSVDKRFYGGGRR